MAKPKSKLKLSRASIVRRVLKLSTSLTADEVVRHLAVLLGLDPDADPTDVLTAARDALLEEEEEPVSGGIVASYMSRRVEEARKLGDRLIEENDLKASDRAIADLLATRGMGGAA